MIGLDRHVAGADVVVTGEGRFDAQSLQGKVVGHVLSAGRPTLVVCGSADPSMRSASVVELVELAGSVEAAMADPVRWLTEAGRRMTTYAPPPAHEEPATGRRL